MSAILKLLMLNSLWMAQTNDTALHPDNPRLAVFKSLDLDKNEFLSETEFAITDQLNPKVIHRNFLLFDFDRDGRLSSFEFLAIPAGQADEHRTCSVDPIVRLFENKWTQFIDRWKAWDADSDGTLNQEEFDGAQVGHQIPGLERTPLKSWDEDQDGKLTQDEARRLLEVSFGIRTPKFKFPDNNKKFEFELLRFDSGRVVNWGQLRTQNAQMNIIQANGIVMNTVGQGTRGFLPPGDVDPKNMPRIDPIETFMKLDTDFDALLSADEALNQSPQQVRIAEFMIPAFDADHDGRLSLEEYRFCPLGNPMANWDQAFDGSQDGNLSLAEFRFQPGLEAICAEYFRRLDIDKDDLLTLDEFAFTTTNSSAQSSELVAQYQDGTRLLISIPGYGMIFSPKLSSSGNQVLMDGWRLQGSLGLSHIFVINLESEEVLDLGRGFVPAWAPNGKQLVFGRHETGGMFLADFERKIVNDRVIDTEALGIQFSPDGTMIAYGKHGNLVIMDVKTGMTRNVFDEKNRRYGAIEHNFGWSPDSERICFRGQRLENRNEGEIAIVNVKGNDPTLRVRFANTQYGRDVTWHPDGKRVMVTYSPPGGQRTQLHEFDPDADTPSVRYANQLKHRNNSCPFWSFDGKLLLYVAQR